MAWKSRTYIFLPHPRLVSYTMCVKWPFHCTRHSKHTRGNPSRLTGRSSEDKKINMLQPSPWRNYSQLVRFRHGKHGSSYLSENLSAASVACCKRSFPLSYQSKTLNVTPEEEERRNPLMHPEQREKQQQQTWLLVSVRLLGDRPGWPEVYQRLLRWILNSSKPGIFSALFNIYII